MGMSLFVNWAIIWLLTTIAAEIIFEDISYYATGAIAVLIVIMMSLLALSSFSDTLARVKNRLRRPTEEEYNYLKPMFDEVYQRSGLKREIELFISRDDFPNGSAMGTKTVAVSEPLFRCTPDEIKAVMAHELGHIKNYDTRIHAIACFLDELGMVALGVAIAILTSLTETFKLFAPFLLLVLMLKVVQVMLNLIIELFYLATRRGMELQADAFAAQLGYRDGMIKVLDRVGDNRKIAFFGTHPLNKMRIAKLMAY